MHTERDSQTQTYKPMQINHYDGKENEQNKTETKDKYVTIQTNNTLQMRAKTTHNLKTNKHIIVKKIYSRI